METPGTSSMFWQGGRNCTRTQFGAGIRIGKSGRKPIMQTWWKGRHASLRGWWGKPRAGSNPVVCTHGGLPKWTTGTDCKSVGFGLRRFESSIHHLSRLAGNWQTGTIQNRIPKRGGGTNPSGGIHGEAAQFGEARRSVKPFPLGERVRTSPSPLMGRYPSS